MTDVIVAAVTSVATLALAPAFYDLRDVIAQDAGPLGSLLLQLVVPALLIGIVVSVAVSARRRD